VRNRQTDRQNCHGTAIVCFATASQDKNKFNHVIILFLNHRCLCGKIFVKIVHYFLRKVASRQTDRQSDKQTDAGHYITSSANVNIAQFQRQLTARITHVYIWRGRHLAGGGPALISWSVRSPWNVSLHCWYRQRVGVHGSAVTTGQSRRVNNWRLCSRGAVTSGEIAVDKCGDSVGTMQLLGGEWWWHTGGAEYLLYSFRHICG